MRKYILAAVAVLAAIFLVGILGRWETHYQMAGVVTETADGVITIKDTAGNLWCLESEEFNLGDNVEMELFTAGTSAVEDDVVEEVKVAK